MSSTPVKQSKPAFVELKKDHKAVFIHWRFSTSIEKNSEGFLDCSIPAFEIFFNADTREEALEKGKAFVRMFFDYYADDKHENMNIRNLSIALIRLGFRPRSIADTQKLTRNKFVPTQFKSPTVQASRTAEEFEMEGELVA